MTLRLSDEIRGQLGAAVQPEETVDAVTGETLRIKTLYDPVALTWTIDVYTWTHQISSMSPASGNFLPSLHRNRWVFSGATNFTVISIWNLPYYWMDDQAPAGAGVVWFLQSGGISAVDAVTQKHRIDASPLGGMATRLAGIAWSSPAICSVSLPVNTNPAVSPADLTRPKEANRSIGRPPHLVYMKQGSGGVIYYPWQTSFPMQLIVPASTTAELWIVALLGGGPGGFSGGLQLNPTVNPATSWGIRIANISTASDGRLNYLTVAQECFWWSDWFRGVQVFPGITTTVDVPLNTGHTSHARLTFSTGMLVGKTIV